MNKFSLSICMPVYKCSHLLKKALDSIIRQEYKGDYEIIIGDDTPPEEKVERELIEKLVQSYKNDRIQYLKNRVNLGYAVNLQNLVRLAKKDIIFLMAQDDILAKDSLQKTHDAFLLDSDVGCVTRPYYSFVDNFLKAVRLVRPFDENKDSVLTVKDKKHFMKIFESVGQLSGLAYRREFIEVPFNEECFPAHIYPFAGIIRKHKCVFLKDYSAAIGILDSQTRSISSIYDLSPTLSWLGMYKSVFAGKEYELQRKWGIEHICKNYMGFVQLKNYAKPGVLMKEIKIFISERPANIFNMKFWFFAVGTLIVPRYILRKLVDWYKDNVYAKTIYRIKINY